MLRTIIIDDETRGRTLLQQLLQKHLPGAVEVVAMADSAEAGRQAIITHKPQMVLLDIEMPFGSGFDLLKQLSEIDFEVVFITAFNHYAIKAFKFNAVDYLLKPIDIDELKAAVEKVQKRIADRAAQPHKYEELFSAMHNPRNPFTKVALPTREGLLFIPLQEIIRCESDGNYTKFHLADGRSILTSRTLGEFHELLSEANFFRVHKSHLVNLNYIRKYVRGEGGSVIMTDNSEVLVSRRNKDALLKKLSM